MIIRRSMQEEILLSDDGDRRHFSPRVKWGLWRPVTDCVITKSLNLQSLFLSSSLCVCVCACARTHTHNVTVWNYPLEKYTIVTIVTTVTFTWYQPRCQKSGGNREIKQKMCVCTLYYKKGQSNCFILVLQKTNIGLHLMLDPMSWLQYSDVNCRNLHFIVFWLISDLLLLRLCSNSSLNSLYRIKTI